MRKLSIVIFLSMFLASCGGRSANPISSRQLGDSDLPCDVIALEMEDLDVRARRLMSEEAEKTGENVAWGVAGFLFIPLFLGLDLSDAERIEAEAMQDRHRYLTRVAHKKGCELF